MAKGYKKQRSGKKFSRTCLLDSSKWFFKLFSKTVLAENGSSDMHKILYEGTFLLFAGIAWCLVVGPKIQMRDQSFHNS